MGKLNLRALRKLTTLADLLGLALFVAGVALVYVPAALMVAGVGVLAVSWRVSTSRPAAPVQGEL